MTEIVLADLKSLVDQDLGCSRWITVDQSRIDAFATTTEDSQWIHIDPTRAAIGPFGTTIAHGYLTLSLISAFLGELLHPADAVSAINYGLNRVRFPSPVRVGSRLRGRAMLSGVRDLEGGLETTTRVTIETDTNDKPACVADVLTRFLR